jgi:glycosyltransferase involved in cell wall biosynthesis
MDQKRYCVVVPAYREVGRIGKVVEAIRQHCKNVVVVDDGSPDNTAKEAEAAGAVVVKHATNLGKGVALNTGFKHARENGYEFLITMDGDGQHDPSDIPGFVEAYTNTGTPVLIGDSRTAL